MYTMQLPTPRDNAFNKAKELARNTGKMDVYESLVIQYTNPQGEWGNNNIRDIITLFHMSGQSDEQIYNILYNMGVEKETAYSAIQQYLPQKNTSEMNVKEQLDFTDKLRNLVDAMNKFKTDDSANYNADAVIRTCESYMSTNKDGATPSILAGMGKRIVSDLNQYDFIPAVKECINGIESSLYENIMGIEIDSAHNELANSAQAGIFSSAINRLKALKEMNEEEIRSNINNEMGEFSSWVPRVHTLLERAEVIIGKEDKVMTLSEQFNLKGKLKIIIEKANSIKSENSAVAVNGIKGICESYLKELYGNSHVSEATIAGNVVTALKQFEWLDSIKESNQEIISFLQENYMSFEVDLALRNLQKTSNSTFYEGAVKKLSQIKSLTESEIRESLKYEMDSLTWVPQIKYLVETVNALEGNISEDKNAKITRLYSPIVEHDGSTYFYLSGNVYGINEGEITTIDPRTMGALYLTLIAVTENFKFSSNSMTYYKGANIINFTLTNEGVEFKFNNDIVKIKESNDIRNFLLSNGSFRMNETSELDMIVKAFENASNFVELDFVNSITSRNNSGLTTNVIRIGESIYINKVNTHHRVNEMIKADSATSAIEMVKEFVNYDISASLFDLLQGEQRQHALEEAKRNQLFDRIQFLQEQRSNIASLNSDNVNLKAADQLLVEEVTKYQNELNAMSRK